MALKYILIPEAMYKNITQKEPSNINLDYERQLLEKAKNERTDPKTKNINYNQELRRYLKIKKEADDKPVRVKVIDGPTVITKTPTITRRTPSTSTAISESIVSEADGDETPIQHENVFVTPEQQATASQTQRRANVPTTIKREELKRRITSVRDYIMKNKQKFGIDDKNRILRPDGKPFKDSDVEGSLLRILAPNPSNAPSPTGTATLRNRIKDDRDAQIIIFDIKQRGEGSSKKHFRPQLWK
jgi:hypothetical protein